MGTTIGRILLTTTDKYQIAECISRKTKFPIDPDNISTTQSLFREDSVFQILDVKAVIAQFSVSYFPGCCGIAISHFSWIREDRRNAGLGTVLNNIRIREAKRWGFTVLMCTDIENNTPQQKILTKNNWQKLMTFTNLNTGNNVAIHAIDLTKS